VCVFILFTGICCCSELENNFTEENEYIPITDYNLHMNVVYTDIISLNSSVIIVTPSKLAFMVAFMAFIWALSS